MPNGTPGVDTTATARERRASQRLRASSLIYVELGKGNGGIVTWISETGMAVTMAGVLKGSKPGDELLKLEIQFPGSPAVVKADGQLVWTSESGKEAGVKFAGLEGEAQEQIKSWISEQSARNSLSPKQAALPNMRLPTDATSKKRGPRFSFADVASSRVGQEEDSPTGDLLADASQAEALPSQLFESEKFVDGGKVVASAFENPAFAEDQRVQASSGGEPTQTPHAPQEARHEQPPASTPRRHDRRSHSRRPILLFTYAVLGDDNGGLVFNLSAGGLAITAAAALRDSHFNRMRVRFPDSEDWIEAQGRLAWVSDSGKEAGIEFVSLAEDARARIGEWVSLGEPEADSQLEKAEARTNQNSPQALPHFEQPESLAFARVPPEPTPGFENQPEASGASRSALFMSGMRGVLARAAVRRRVAKIKPKPARRVKQVVKPQSSLGHKALVPAAAVVLFAAGWIFLQRSHLNEERKVVAQDIPSVAIPDAAKQEPLAAGNPAADPGFPPNGNIRPPAKTPKPPAENLDTGADSVWKQSVRNQNDETLQHAAAVSSTPHSADRSERKTEMPRELRPEPRRSAPPAPDRPPQSRTAENRFKANKPVESKPVQTAEVLQASNKELNAIAPALNATPFRPEAASTFGKEKEASPAAPKQPEVPLVRTPLVTVSFDRFPSIRMPNKENSKKSRQGKSLQMGNLIMRVDPVYPEEAKQQDVEGAVKLHVVFNREGAVESLDSVSGPPLLVPAAMKAVRQWRYSPTILGGQAMETEEDVAVLFRLTGGSRN